MTDRRIALVWAYTASVVKQHRGKSVKSHGDAESSINRSGELSSEESPSIGSGQSQVPPSSGTKAELKGGLLQLVLVVLWIHPMKKKAECLPIMTQLGSSIGAPTTREATLRDNVLEVAFKVFSKMME